MAEASSLDKSVKFVLSDVNRIWKLRGIHPRRGPHWECLHELQDEQKIEITGCTGDIFKIQFTDLEETFATISENNCLHEINDIIFENFVYSFTRKWHNITSNAATLKQGLRADVSD